MVFDVVFQSKFIGKPFATWITTIRVGIQMTMNVVQYTTPAKKFLATTSQITSRVVNDTIMIFGLDKSFKFIAANFAYHAEEFPDLTIFFGGVFLTSTSWFYIRTLIQCVFFIATFILNVVGLVFNANTVNSSFFIVISAIVIV